MEQTIDVRIVAGEPPFYLWRNMDTLESRFTPTSEFCPKPEYWHSNNEHATEWEVSAFIGALVEMVQPELVVETGTYHGDTSQLIGEALLMNEHGHLITIEKDTTAFAIAVKGLSGTYSEVVTAIHGNSLEYNPEQNIDLAFFDSWQEGRAEEFMHFFELGKLNPGAIVVFHDTAPHHAVHKYVEQLEKDEYIKTIRFHTPRGVTLGVVL